MTQKLESIQYHIDTSSNLDSMIWVMQKLTEKKAFCVPENGKVRFSGHVDVELDFNKEIENYYLSNIKSL